MKAPEACVQRSKNVDSERKANDLLQAMKEIAQRPTRGAIENQTVSVQVSWHQRLRTSAITERNRYAGSTHGLHQTRNVRYAPVFYSGPHASNRPEAELQLDQARDNRPCLGRSSVGQPVSLH